METGLPRACVATALAIRPCPCQHTADDRQHTGISRATFGPRPGAIPHGGLQAALKRHEAGGAEAVGRAERSDGDGNVRQVSEYRHGGWRAMPSVSMRERTGVRRQPRRATAPCGPPITPLACIVVTLGAMVTTVHIDAPDLLGSRCGLGTLGRMWPTLLSRCRGMDLFD